MFVLKTSDRNQLEQEAGGGKEGKQRSMCGLLRALYRLAMIRR
jgi:hypothetical protein